MTPTRVRGLAVVAVAATLVALLVLRILRSMGHDAPAVPWTAAAGLLLVAAAVVAAAAPVRRMTHGGPRAVPVDPLRAARTAVLGKATAYVGALLVGWYLAQVLLLAPDLDISTRRALAIKAGLTGLAALVACAGGVLAERMCRVPRDPDDPTAPTRAGFPNGRPAGTDVTGETGRHD